MSSNVEGGKKRKRPAWDAILSNSKQASNTTKEGNSELFVQNHYETNIPPEIMNPNFAYLASVYPDFDEELKRVKRRQSEERERKQQNRINLKYGSLTL